MSSNILQLPFRHSHSVSLSTAIKSYISTKYDQHPDMFSEDLSRIDSLRESAINVLEPHTSGVQRLTSYIAQLRFLGGKFPIDIGASFTWFPALGYDTNKSTSQNNLRFELANVLYNLAALYSQLAMGLNRTTSDGLKSANSSFCLAAGALKYLREEVIPEMRTSPPDDMDDMTLQSLEELMLAQAQECFWQKAVKDGLKDSTIARLAAKVSDFYSQAGDFGIKSDSVSTEWIHHTTAKHHHFAAAAQYRQSKDCLEKRKYGEEVARLRDSLVCVNEALKESRWINRVVLGDLNGLKNRVSEDLKRAEKDNDVIYLLPIPPKSELKTLERANMALARVPQEVAESMNMLGEGKPFGKPLFEKLVPYAVHVAASIYVERRDRLVNQNVIGELEAMTKKLRDLLSSLNLPGSLQALEKPLGLPPSLTSKAEELRQQDALNRLQRSMDDVSTLRSNDYSIYTEGLDLLRSEKSDDERLRGRYGSERWTRPPSEPAAPEIYRKAKEIEGYFTSARMSDDLAAKKVRDAENILRILTGSTRDLSAFVPNSRQTTLTPKVEQELASLRSVLNDVSRLETRRKRAIEALREKAKEDEINPALLTETSRLERAYPSQPISPSQFEPLFTERLAAYDSSLAIVTEESSAQSALEQSILHANSTFTAARKGDRSSKEREKALQELEDGWKKYGELLANCETGRAFYNDLARVVRRWRGDLGDWVNQRREEATHLESDINFSNLTLSSPHPQPSHETVPTAHQPRIHQNQQVSRPPQQYQHQQQYQQPGPTLQGPIPPQPHLASNQQQPPMPAPQPTRAAGAPLPPVAGMWTPDQGIRFGTPGSGQHGPGQGQAQGRPGQWDQNRDIRFS